MKKNAHSLWFHIVACLLVYASVNQSDVCAGITFGTMKADRILYLGNSMTMHGPRAEVGWYGNWGMAASVAEKDYVHVLTNSIAQVAGETPSTMVTTIVDLEKNHANYDVDAINAMLQAELAYQPDIVVVAIGENVSSLTTSALQASYATAFENLLDTLKDNGNPAVFVRSCFWVNAIKDSIMQQAAADKGCVFVDISAIGADPLNRASAEDDFPFPDATPAVLAHPGDRGMAAIAGELFNAMEAHAAPEPSSIALLSMGVLFLAGFRFLFQGQVTALQLQRRKKSRKLCGRKLPACDD